LQEPLTLRKPSRRDPSRPLKVSTTHQTLFAFWNNDDFCSDEGDHDPAGPVEEADVSFRQIPATGQAEQP
jgi:hypothetical protein